MPNGTEPTPPTAIKQKILALLGVGISAFAVAMFTDLGKQAAEYFSSSSAENKTPSASEATNASNQKPEKAVSTDRQRKYSWQVVEFHDAHDQSNGKPLQARYGSGCQDPNQSFTRTCTASRAGEKIMIPQHTKMGNLDLEVIPMNGAGEIAALINYGIGARVSLANNDTEITWSGWASNCGNDQWTPVSGNTVEIYECREE